MALNSQPQLGSLRLASEAPEVEGPCRVDVVLFSVLPQKRCRALPPFLFPLRDPCFLALLPGQAQGDTGFVSSPSAGKTWAASKGSALRKGEDGGLWHSLWFCCAQAHTEIMAMADASLAS